MCTEGRVMLPQRASFVLNAGCAAIRCKPGWPRVDPKTLTYSGLFVQKAAAALQAMDDRLHSTKLKAETIIGISSKAAAGQKQAWL